MYAKYRGYGFLLVAVSGLMLFSPQLGLAKGEKGQSGKQGKAPRQESSPLEDAQRRLEQVEAEIRETEALLGQGLAELETINEDLQNYESKKQEYIQRRDSLGNQGRVREANQVVEEWNSRYAPEMNRLRRRGAQLASALQQGREELQELQQTRAAVVKEIERLRFGRGKAREDLDRAADGFRDGVFDGDPRKGSKRPRFPSKVPPVGPSGPVDVPKKQKG